MSFMPCHGCGTRPKLSRYREARKGHDVDDDTRQRTLAIVVAMLGKEAADIDASF